MPPLPKTIYTGTFIHTPHLGALSVAEHLAVGVDETGTIRHITNLLPGGRRHDRSDVVNERKRVRAVAVRWGWGEEEEEEEEEGGWRWVVGGREGGGWWFPGFVDTHIHASQYPNVGLFGKTTLLDWLTTYTFPLESSLKDEAKAQRVYNSCVSRTLSHGTTTAAYFATAHASSTNILATTCLRLGQRAFIGRVCMDSSLSPEYYRDPSPAFALSETQAVIAHIAAIDPTHTLLTPIITPRFAPSCSSTLLSGLGSLAQETSLPIQTHISENPSECALVKHLFPSSSSYADVYATHNLLTPRTVLAHAIHLSAAELALVKSHGSAISHCPTSNTALSSGLCPVRALLDAHIPVGLGTDVSGGYTPSVLAAARDASLVSRTLASLVSEDEDREIELPVPEEEIVPNEPNMPRKTTVREHKKLSVEECLYLATRGGARCLGLGEKVGGFEVGMEWDAQLVELAEVGGQGEGEDEGLVELWGEETWEEKVAKWLFCGDDRNTKRVYVRGVLVHERR